MPNARLLSSVKMDPSEFTRSQPICCDGCRQPTPSYDIVNYGSIERGYRRLCSQCFNTQVAEAAGLEGFEHAKFEPVGLADCVGEVHEFHFRTHLFGPGVAVDAFELRDGAPAGYHFQIIGNPEDDLLELLGRLIAKIRRALSTKHLVDGELGLQIGDNRVVRGMVESDREYDGRVPLLIIDGREITWDEFGRMLLSFEGWQFKLNLVDKSEEL
jgi:hypothetical protein